MKIDIFFISKLRHHKLFKVVNLPHNETSYEYNIANFPEGNVIGTLNLENEVLDINGEAIGYFGIDFANKVLAYKLNKKGK
jgi:hypothetical protein